MITDYSLLFISVSFLPKVDNLKRVQPTKFLGVPRVWEKIAEKMQEAGKSNKGLKKIIGNFCSYYVHSDLSKEYLT